MGCPRRPPRKASLSDVFYVYLLLLRPRFFANYVNLYEGLRTPARSMQYMDGVNQLILLLLIS